jgi:hypothetical protein
MTTRRDRGSETQALVAALFRETWWPDADTAGAGRPGKDITHAPGLACEVKARRDFAPGAWLRQASDRDGLPFVIWRPDGSGPATVRAWPAMLRTIDLLTILHLAGYGTPEDQ